MKKKKSLSKLKKELWEIFRRYIYIRDNFICFTCGRKTIQGVNTQAGHFIKASVCGIELYFHEDNVHVQCSHCNLWLDGNQYLYGIKLGKKKVAELEAVRKKTKGKQWTRKEYEKKIAHYKELTAEKP